MTNERRVLSLLKDLVATPSESPPGREAEVAKVLREHMEGHGISCVSVSPREGRPNLVFSTSERQTGDLVLHGHLDTVPIGPRENWNYDPFGAEIARGKLYGRGAADMKGPVAALAEAMILYDDEGHSRPLTMLATSDEESGCFGAEEVADSGLLNGVAWGVCAEPTSLNVLVGEKGTFWHRVIAEGKSAHGSRPHEGLNAITLCMKALEVLTAPGYEYEPDELMGESTINVGKISGGTKINVVPDYCEAEVDMRTVKGQTNEGITKQMTKRLEQEGLSEEIRVEYIHGKPAVVTPRDAEIVKVSMDAVKRVTGREPSPNAATYGTDCSVLQPRIGIVNVICGPGSIEQAHQPDEYIRVDELVQSVDVYLEIARHFSGD
ncbi:MAG: M20 family metallopeptidase [Candidatus Thorarchaeota archaeon]|nr:MAG: M20 family metallopeptidase [Candidatus Thorarchaeota archaeon]